MSNIKTRKGLAFGALVALGASLIAGAPAHAAGELNVVPAAGSLLSTLSTETFSLNTNFTGVNGTTFNIDNLRYQVKSSSAIALGQGNTEANAQNDLGNVVLTDGVVDVATAGTNANNFLAVALQSAAASVNVEVTAYVDENEGGSFTAGEPNTVKTISFKTLASVTKAVNLDTPHTDDANVTGQVTLEGINLTQIQSGVSVEVATYDSTNRVYNNAFWATVTASTLKFTYAYGPLVSGANISARAYLGEDETAFASAIKKVVAHTVLDITSTVVAGPNAHADGDVRANSPYAVTATVWDKLVSADDEKGVAGAAVKATIGATLPVTAATPVARSITINGTTYTTQADLDAASIALTSDADGKVTLNVTTVGFVAGDVVTFHFVSENLTSTVNSLVVPVAYQLIDSADKHNNNWRSAVAGSTLSIAYSVVDQFGQAPANGKYAVVVGEDALDGIVEAHADVVNGVATVSVAVPATPATTVYDVAAELFIYGTEHSFVTAEGTNILENGGFNVQVAASNEVTAATVSISYDGAPDTYAIDEVVFSNVDGRYAGLFGYNTWPSVDTDGDWAHMSAVVKAGDVATHTIAGAPVTISAPGLLIQSGGHWGVGTLTVLADSNGFVDFYVTSHTAGKQTVTVTSGAATASKETKPWVANAAKAVTAVVASASYTTGRTVLVEFTAVDEYGNAAASTYGTAKATVTGAGYLVGSASNIGQTVDVAFTAGKGSVTLVNGADQIGSATVTLTLPTAADKSVTAASTYNFGQTDANLNISGKRVTADWVFAAGKTVTITRDGVTIRTFKPTSNSADSFSFNLKKSKKAHRVTIKVNGVTITDAGYLVKK